MAKYDVFISYSRLDTKIADRICEAFDAAGITYFIDRQGLSAGMEFPKVLADAIENSKLFLFLASQNSYKSKFTDSEITYAFNIKEKGNIIPYIIDGSTLPKHLQFVFSSINWRVRRSNDDIEICKDVKLIINDKSTIIWKPAFTEYSVQDGYYDPIPSNSRKYFIINDFNDISIYDILTGGKVSMVDLTKCNCRKYERIQDALFMDNDSRLVILLYQSFRRLLKKFELPHIVIIDVKSGRMIHEFIKYSEEGFPYDGGLYAKRRLGLISPSEFCFKGYKGVYIYNKEGALLSQYKRVVISNQRHIIPSSGLDLSEDNYQVMDLGIYEGKIYRVFDEYTKFKIVDTDTGMKVFRGDDDFWGRDTYCRRHYSFSYSGSLLVRTSKGIVTVYDWVKGIKIKEKNFQGAFKPLSTRYPELYPNKSFFVSDDKFITSYMGDRVFIWEI